ncbi:hypothetical protein N800_06735 [Lysobacter daejeonensis GH1-9]|uniref:Uncharacterized protein n=1 Tax=Lysobacter daejeonensis GH1-9 TaxID=1385517 RepID=A0A0A0EVV4_9GAMM|nr:hypothetical protein [Lysobacter daejeonensis]KGM54669.1 hypothetical protein N800_06735 [Lysobacter daejeonensis GH1-9]
MTELLNDELVDRYIEHRRRERAREAAITSPAIAPDDMAKAQRLGAAHGIGPQAVADDLKHYDELDQVDRMERFATSTPGASRWLTPERAALVRDDVDTLERLGRALPSKGATMRATPEPGIAEELVTQAHAAWVRGKNYVSTFLLDPMLPDLVDDDVARGLGFRDAEDYSQTQAAARYAQENRRAAGIERLSSATAAQQQEIADADGWKASAKAIATNPRAVGVTIVQSLGQGAPALAATAAASMFGPGATATAAGGGSFAVEYGNAIATAMQRAGVDDTDLGSVKGFITDPKRMQAAREYAMKRGVPVALFDAATAGLAGRLLAGARATAGSVAVRSTGEAGLQAGGGAAGELTAQLASGDEINPSDVLMEAFAEIPTAVAEVPGNYATVRERAAAREAHRLIQSADDAAKLAEFTSSAAEAKLGQRNPAELAAFVEAAGEHQVYLAAEAAQVLFQSANVDPDAVAAELTGREGAWREALETGGDLVIPAAKWATVVARLPNAAEFARDARFTEDALSARELETHDVGALAAASDAQAASGGLAATPEATAQRVEDDVLAQLQATGVYTAADAQRQARLYGAMFRTLGQRLGTDAWSLYEPYALTIAKAEGQVPRGLRALMQRAADGLGALFGREAAPAPNPRTATPEFQRWFGGSRVVTEEGAPRTVYHGTAEDFWVFEGKHGTATGHATAPLGHFFTGNRNLAQGYAENAAQGVPADERVIDAYLAISNPYEMSLEEAQELDSQEAAIAFREFLQRQGYDGIHIADADNWIAFHSKQVKSASQNRGTFDPNDPHILHQGGTERGRILINGDRTLRIELLKRADLSTFLHETGHLFWEVFSDAAKREDAPQGVRDDYAAALEWFGVETEDQVTTDHLEQWARGFERYLADGEAPTPEMQSLFDRFRAWLLDVYRDLVRLKVELRPEIREVFDRLLATDEEIAAAQADAGTGPIDLGAEPAALGVSPTRWAAYLDSLQALRADALTAATTRRQAAERREAKALREEQRHTVREEVEREIAESPGMVATRALAGTAEAADIPDALRGLKLDAKALGGTEGGSARVEQLRPLGVVQDQGGVDPDTAAALLGFPSGDAMVSAILDANGRNVEADTEARLNERHPQPGNDGDPAAAAMAAATSDRRVEVIDAEMGMLADLAQEPRPNRRVLRAVAAEIIARRPIHSIRPSEFLIAERRAARKAQQSAARGRYAEALKAKREQMLNAVLHSEAMQVRERVERQVGFAQRLETPASRKRLGRAGVLDAVEQVLEQYSFRPISDRQRARTATLSAWYDRMLAQGIDPQVPEAVMRQLEEGRRTHYRDMTPQQLDELVGVLRLLDHQAREALQLRLAGEQHDLDASAEALSQAVRGALKDRGPPPVSEVLNKRFPERAKRLWRAAGAMLLRMRTLANWVDGEGNTEGAFSRLVIRPLDRAQARYLDLMQDYGGRVVALFDEYLKGRELARPIWIASINQNLTKSDVLAVALNTGNASNLQRLQDGRQWGDVQLMEILGHMEKADWDFVQAVWNTLETLWPQIAEQQQRLTGVAPPKIEPLSVQTPFGQYPGGYYPLVYDRDSTQWKAFVNADSDSFFDPMALTTLPPNGHTKERVQKAKLPVKLDLAVIPAHLSSILKDLTHRETVIGIRKLMKHADVVGAMNDTMGPEYLDMVEDKLRQVATDQLVQAARAFGPLRAFSRGVRRHVGIMAQGLNVSSGLKQVIGVSNSVEVLKARYGVRGVPMLLMAYGSMFKPGSVDAVMRSSGEMRHRIDTADADIRLNMNRYLAGQMSGGLKGKAANLYDGAIAHAYIFIRYIQTYTVDLPLWIAAHEGALRQGLEGDAAIAAADDAVITAQGAGGAKDTALIEGDVMFLEWLTMFYSYGSAYLNRQVSMGRDIGRALDGGPGRLMAELPLLSARALFLVAVPVILDDLINRGIGAEDGEGEDEDLVEYYAKRMGAYLFYGIPGLRDIVGAKYGYRLSPVQSIPEAWSRLSRDVTKAMGGEELEARKVARNAVNVAGYTLGLPLAGPWRHVDYLWRVAEDEENPESIPEFAAAVIVAKREQR